MLTQKTLSRSARLEGVGLHTGRAVHLEILPAPIDAGVVFVRTDIAGEPRVEACLENLADLPRRTALSRGAAEVCTVEHLLAVFAVLGVRNAEVRIDGPEVPGMDGSSLPFLEAIREAGIEDQSAPVRALSIDEPVAVASGSASVAAYPSEPAGTFEVSYTLDYDSPLVDTQYLRLTIDEDTFAREIAPARTFVLESEVDALRAAGLGKGATTENTLVLGEAGIIDNQLRFEDEFVRHKILDLIGDLFLAGQPVHASVHAIKSGHDLNSELARRLLASCARSGSAERSAPRASFADGDAARVPYAEESLRDLSKVGSRFVGANGHHASAQVASGLAARTELRGEPESGGEPRGGSGMARPFASMSVDSLGGHVEPASAVAASPLGARAIEEILPHRYPFLLVDRVLEVRDGQFARGVKSVSYNEQHFQGHFPGHPVMPGVLVVESMAQLAGILLHDHEQNRQRTAYLLSLDGVKFRRPVVPGDQLQLEAELVAMKPRTAHLRTRALVDGNPVSEAEIRFVLVPTDEETLRQKGT